MLHLKILTVVFLLGSLPLPQCAWMYSDSLSLLIYTSLCEAQKHVGRQHYINFELDILYKLKTWGVMAHQIPMGLYLTEQNPSWTAIGRWASQNIIFLWNPKVYYRVYNRPPHEALMILSRTYFTVSCYSKLNTLSGRPSYTSHLRLFQCTLICCWFTFPDLISSIRNPRTRHVWWKGIH